AGVVDFSQPLVCKTSTTPSLGARGDDRFTVTATFPRSPYLPPLTFVRLHVPGVPGRDLDVRTHAFALAVRVRVTRVMARDAIDAVQPLLAADELGHAPAQRDVRRPVLHQDGQRDVRVLAHPREPLAAAVHVHDQPPLVPQVPGGDGVRLAGRRDRAD